MNDSCWPQPQPEPITHISPSAAVDLESCELRVSFARDSKFKRLRRPSVTAAAGMIAHSVYERIAAGDYTFLEGTDPVGVIDGLWDTATAHLQKAFQKSWAPAAVPAPDQWPNMARTRRSVLRSQAPYLIPGHVRPTASTPNSGKPYPEPKNNLPPGPMPWIERRLRDDYLGLEGTPDRVERHDDGIWILDLKSGWEQDEATESQRQQLFIYAHLVDQVAGERPTHAAIDARKGRFSFPLTWSDVAAAANHLASIRATFNTKITTGAAPRAEPSPDTCRYCRFRLVCEPSQSSISEDWRLPLVVTGTVTTVEILNERIAVDLNVAYPTWQRGTRSRVVGVPWQESPQLADVVSISRLHSSSDGLTLTGAWDSLSYTLQSNAHMPIPET